MKIFAVRAVKISFLHILSIIISQNQLKGVHVENITELKKMQTSTLAEPHPKLKSYLLDPQISSHLSRHDMTCLSASQISSHLSRLISDKPHPKSSHLSKKLSRQTWPGQLPSRRAALRRRRRRRLTRSRPAVVASSAQWRSWRWRSWRRRRSRQQGYGGQGSR